MTNRSRSLSLRLSEHEFTALLEALATAGTEDAETAAEKIRTAWYGAARP